jgi:hypothetical protein
LVHNPQIWYTAETVSCRQAAQLSTNKKMSLLWTTTVLFSTLKNPVNMVVVMHTFVCSISHI